MTITTIENILATLNTLVECGNIMSDRIELLEARLERLEAEELAVMN